MKQEKKGTLSIQQLAQDLSTFAIDRTDLKSFLAKIPENSHPNLNTIEYELQILKILSVGWAISFFMPASDKNKEPLTQIFWEAIREISIKISTLAATTTGKHINYFDILKNRLDTYLAVMQKSLDKHQNPAGIIGPAFARACDTENDSHVILIGTKMFTLTLGAVKEYLNTMGIDNITLN
ncbi:MAG: hypothetical protein H8D87_16485 [Deltaproteobacteria bacterium]|uniref:hypothetical protein n=1 Tax=Desulfobacula sp. TaxID=2593537 RepID=UPI0019985D37|nr:hypothetical protein [Candidatus Desulfobacula maris]MBL6994266.1 hypothetical protein [Desulfobacula sp.]